MIKLEYDTTCLKSGFWKGQVRSILRNGYLSSHQYIITGYIYKYIKMIHNFDIVMKLFQLNIQKNNHKGFTYNI